MGVTRLLRKVTVLKNSVDFQAGYDIFCSQRISCHVKRAPYCETSKLHGSFPGVPGWLLTVNRRRLRRRRSLEGERQRLTGVSAKLRCVPIRNNSKLNKAPHFRVERSLNLRTTGSRSPFSARPENKLVQQESKSSEKQTARTICSCTSTRALIKNSKGNRTCARAS